MKTKTKYQIFDWAGNRIDQKTWPDYWTDIEDADGALSEFIDSYCEDENEAEQEFEEYQILEIEDED